MPEVLANAAAGLVDAVRQAARPLTGAAADYDALLELIGDARATEVGEQGEWNVGQLVRERHGQEAVLIGFSTYTGSVTAASDWDEPPRRKRARPALPDSYEALFHAVGVPAFVLALRGGSARLRLGLRQHRLERTSSTRCCTSIRRAPSSRSNGAPAGNG